MKIMIMRFIKYFFIFTLFLFLVISFCLGALNNKIVGMADHPGLQGEILMQGNVFYNFEKGNALKYFKTDYLNYPYGEDLSFAIANSFHLFMYIPLRFFFGVAEAYNIFVIVIFLLNFLTAYLLAKYLFSLRYIALCSALVFALNPYFLLKLNMGFAQKYTLFLIPLYFLYLFKLRDKRKWVYAFICGIILCLIQFFYPPYAYYTLIFTFIMLSYVFLKRDEFIFAATRFVFLLFFFTAGTFLIYFSLGLKDSYLSVWNEGFKISTNGCLSLFNPFHFFPYSREGYSVGLPLGISIFVFILALTAFVKGRGMPRLLFLSALVFIILSAGPYLTHEGRIVTFFGYNIKLPFYFMIKYLPLAAGISFPIRLFPFIYLSFSILTGYALYYVRPYLKRVNPFFIAAGFLVIYVSETMSLFSPIFPVRISDVKIPEFYKNVKKEKNEAILNLPVSTDRRIVNLYGYYSVLSGKKMMNSYNKEMLVYIPKNKDNTDLKKSFLRSLSGWNVGYIVLHRKFLLQDKTGQIIDEYSWLRYFCETALFDEDDLVVYTVPRITINIPEQFESIQKGIDEAKDGDVIVVSPGVYKENINFKGKVIVLKSRKGPERTIIDGGKKGPVVIFDSGEGNDSVLEGFTVCNGSGMLLAADDTKKSLKRDGGGVICINSSPAIRNNIIRNNKAEDGGGICCLRNSSPLIADNIIKYNKSVKGGGIRCSLYSSPKIVNNRIFGNRVSRLGGGIYWRVGSFPYIDNNVIINNFAGEKGGGIFGSSHIKNQMEQKDVMLTGCVIRGNASPLGSSIALGGPSSAKVKIFHCNIESGKNSISDPENMIILLSE